MFILVVSAATFSGPFFRINIIGGNGSGGEVFSCSGGCCSWFKEFNGDGGGGPAGRGRLAGHVAGDGGGGPAGGCRRCNLLLLLLFLLLSFGMVAMAGLSNKLRGRRAALGPAGELDAGSLPTTSAAKVTRLPEDDDADDADEADEDDRDLVRFRKIERGGKVCAAGITLATVAGLLLIGRGGAEEAPFFSIVRDDTGTAAAAAAADPETGGRFSLSSASIRPSTGRFVIGGNADRGDLPFGDGKASRLSW